MAKAQRGDPQMDQNVKDLIKQMEKMFFHGKHGDALNNSVFRNLDLETLMVLYRITGAISVNANYYCHIRHEQS